MSCASLRRMLAVMAVGALTILLADLPTSAQVGFPGGGNFGGKGGRGRGKGGFGGGPGGFNGPAVILPEGLNHVPSDAVAFVHIRVADSLGGPVSVALIKQLRPDGEQGKFVTQVEKRLGLRLADVESITVFMLGPLDSSPALSSASRAAASQRASAGDANESLSCVVALTFAKPVDRKTVLHALAKPNDSLWPKLSGMFLSDRCVLFGSPAGLLNYTTRKFERWTIGGPLYHQLAAGADPHLIVAGAQIPAAVRAPLQRSLREKTLGPFGASCH